MVKPLPAAPLTRTDWGIFLLLAARRGCTIENLLLECSADNRDAELMLWAQQCREIGITYRLDACCIGNQWVGAARPDETHIAIGGSL